MTNLTVLKQKTKKNQIVKKNQNAIINEFMPLIRHVARKMAAKTRYTIEVDEMFSYGVLGLIDAIEKYDPKKENLFKTYAEYRIRGAMLDYLRELDPVTRNTRDKIKLVEKTSMELESELGRKADSTELSKALNLSKDEFFDLSASSRRYSFLSIDNKADNKSENRCMQIKDEQLYSNPADKLEFEAIKNILGNAIAMLSENEKSVVALYYYEEMNLKEIGKSLNVSESRASQLHKQAVLKLKRILANSQEDIEIAA